MTYGVPDRGAHLWTLDEEQSRPLIRAAVEAGLNFFDILQIQGKYQVKPPFPFTPGAEVAGVVDATGEAVRNFSVGDPVMALTRTGGFAQYSLAEDDRTFHLLAGMEFTEAAAMPIVYHTTYYALHRRAVLAANEWLLVHAGASGTGMAAIQMGRAFGARVIATAGSAQKLEFCREQGAEHALDYRDSSWVERIKEITQGKGANVIYDPVGGEITGLSSKCIAPEGRLLVIGFASGAIPAIQANRILLKNISIVGVHWGGYINDHPEFLAHTQEVLAAMYLSGELKPVVHRVSSLERAPAALCELAQRKVLGKAVLTTE
jgi:NADPH2:quinone reductase